MFDRSLLTENLPTVATPWLKNLHATQPGHAQVGYEYLSQEFLVETHAWFCATKINQLTGLDAFMRREIIMGCNHAIDDLIMTHGLDNLQIFQHDYTYYSRLNPRKTWAQPGSLQPNRPVLMAMPSPGYLNIHPYQQEILDEAWAKNCPVHLDCAWLGAARGITFNFDHPAVASVSMSLSKSMDLWWNRIGIRYTKIQDDTNAVTIYNKHCMIPTGLIQTGLRYVRCVAPDHVWDHFHDRYMNMCEQLYLRPTAMIHVAQSLDRQKMYGVKKLLEVV